MTTTVADEILDRLESPLSSYWLQDALRALLARDPIDAAADAAVLARLIAARRDEILAAGRRQAVRA